MAYAEKRGNLWRARWRGPDGTLESKPGFTSRKAAEDYGRDQESAIRTNTYIERKLIFVCPGVSCGLFWLVAGMIAGYDADWQCGR